MTGETMDTLTIRGITPRLKGKIARRVADTGTNMNDLLVGILAGRFHVRYTPEGPRRLKQIGSSGQLLLEMPAGLKQAIINEAAANRETQMNVVRRILCQEFGVKYEPTGRWAGKQRSRKTAAA